MKTMAAILTTAAALTLAGCSSSTSADNAAAENVTLESNLTAIDEPAFNETLTENGGVPFNETNLANDAAIANDIAAPETNLTIPLPGNR